MVVEDINTYITPVYPHDGHFRFAVQGPESSKGYEFEKIKEATKGRAFLIKQLKREGLTVICVRLH